MITVEERDVRFGLSQEVVSAWLGRSGMTEANREVGRFVEPSRSTER